MPTYYVPVLQSLITVTGVVIGAVLTAILARRSYVKQKTIDRKDDLRKRKAEEYERYIKAFREVFRHAARLRQQGGQNSQTEWFLGESWGEYDAAYNFLVVVASDDVFLRATDLHSRLSEHVDRGSIDAEKMRVDEEIRNLYVDLVTAMRRDCFESTGLSSEVIGSRLKW